MNEQPFVGGRIAARRGTRLLAIVVTALAFVAACGEDAEDVVVDDPADDVVDEPADDPADDAPAGGATRPADVAVTVDGELVPLERACLGVDGAIVAVSTTGRRIILVREEGLALRLETEGETFAETADVDVEEVGVTTVFSGVVLVEGQPTPVVVEAGRGADLDVCPSLE